MFKYLHEDQYYIDLYDLHTIEDCLNRYHDIKNKNEDMRDSKEFKNFTSEEVGKEVNKIASYSLNILKAHRYRHKKETIQKWMDRDRIVQKKFDSATPLRKVLCKECFTETEIIFKDFHNIYEENSRVLFMFECPKSSKIAQQKISSGLRNKAIISLMLHCGLRVSEVSDLRPGNINITKGKLRVESGKGNKDRDLAIPEFKNCHCSSIYFLNKILTAALYNFYGC